MEANKKLQEFISMYNNGEIEYENTPLDDAYEMLEEAEDRSKDIKERISIAKKVYKKYPECFDALLLQVKLEENFSKKLKLLNKGLIDEKKRLENENYFDKDNIGYFYGIFETRPYIGGLYMKADILLLTGKIKQGIEVCKEILKLNDKIRIEGYTLIPLKMYFVKNKVKVLLGICKGKKLYDKRETIKKRDMERELRQKVKGE